MSAKYSSELRDHTAAPLTHLQAAQVKTSIHGQNYALKPDFSGACALDTWAWQDFPVLKLLRMNLIQQRAQWETQPN